MTTKKAQARKLGRTIRRATGVGMVDAMKFAKRHIRGREVTSLECVKLVETGTVYYDGPGYPPETTFAYAVVGPKGNWSF